MHKNCKDISNQKFGKLLVLEIDSQRQGKAKKIQWKCLCECGIIISVSGANLKNGNTKSCGCYGLEFDNR